MGPRSYERGKGTTVTDPLMWPHRRFNGAAFIRTRKAPSARSHRIRSVALQWGRVPTNAEWKTVGNQRPIPS